MSSIPHENLKIKLYRKISLKMITRVTENYGFNSFRIFALQG